MKTKPHAFASDPGAAGSPQPDPRVLALARALGRYQALRDMEADRATTQANEVEDADDRAWPVAAAKPRKIELYSLGAPCGFLPGFMGSMAARPGSGAPAFHLGR